MIVIYSKLYLPEKMVAGKLTQKNKGQCAKFGLQKLCFWNNSANASRKKGETSEQKSKQM